MRRLSHLFSLAVIFLFLIANPQAFSQELAGVINTRAMGSDKPLGITYDPTRNAFAFVDGARNEIFIIKVTEEAGGEIGAELVDRFRLSENDLVIPAGIAYVPMEADAALDQDIFAVTQGRAITSANFPADPVLGIFFFGLQGGASLRRIPADLFGSQSPGGIAFDPTSADLLVTDAVSDQIIRIGSDGTPIATIFLAGRADFDSDSPAGIEIEPETGNIAFVDTSDRQVYVIDEAGNLMTRFSTAQFGILSPMGIAIDPNTRDIAISDFESEKIYIIREGADVQMEIIAPLEGLRVFGSRVTVAARLTQGSPSRVDRIAGVRFDIRQVGSNFSPVMPVAPGVNPNPDTQAPYLVHVDMTSAPFTPGDYEVRAVVMDRITRMPRISTPVQFTVVGTREEADAVEELVDGRHSQTVSLIPGVMNRIETGNSANQDSSISIEIPPGVPLDPGASLRLIYPDPNTVVFTDPVTMEDLTLISLTNNIVQDIGSYMTFELQGGESEFSEDSRPELVWAYKDEDQDGIVDGTDIREVDLKICVLQEAEDPDNPTGRPRWVGVASSRVDPANNLLIGEVSSFSEFSLLGIAPMQILGKVVSSEGGEGVADADVDLEGAFNLGVDTNENGEFVFAQVVVGEYTASAFKRGFVAPPAQSIQPQAGGVITLDDFVMDPGGADQPTGVCPLTALLGESTSPLLGYFRSLRDGLTGQNRLARRLTEIYYWPHSGD